MPDLVFLRQSHTHKGGKLKLFLIGVNLHFEASRTAELTADRFILYSKKPGPCTGLSS